MWLHKSIVKINTTPQIYIYIYILALRSCDARLNQNSYVDNFIINLLKIK